MWSGGVMVRVVDLWLKGRRFDPQPFRFRVTTLSKLFTHVPLFAKQNQPVLEKGQRRPVAGKVNAGLLERTGSSHQVCTCVHDLHYSRAVSLETGVSTGLYGPLQVNPG